MTQTGQTVCYLEPTQESGRAFVMRRISGPVVMLNPLRLRETTDYSAATELAPSAPISGAAALQRYIDPTLPFLRASGGDMLVQQSSVESFLAFPSHEAYLAGMGHRTATVEDSRLLPLSVVGDSVDVT